MVAPTSTSRVWVLGAGFSASLGAPLLNQMMSLRLRTRLINAELLASSGGSENATAYIQDLVYALYHHGTGYGEGYLLEPRLPPPRNETGLWNHPEEYLERLDEFAAGSGQELLAIRDRFIAALSADWGVEPVGDRLLAHLLQRKADGTLPALSAVEFAREAKRIVAAECCLFLRTVSAKSERAKPYLRWLRNLGTASNRDTVVTFNYDCVVEKLGEAANRDVVVAGTRGDIATQEQRAKSLGSVLLVKLHGSVDWQRIASGKDIAFGRSGDLEYAAKSPEGQIATPGESKLASSQGDLLPLWGLAARKIREADEVIFIGYRIPESDAAAREMILDALRDNARGTLHVKIVLGPPSFDRERLSTLVRVALPHRSLASSLNVQVLDSWAQDYLQAWPG